MINTRTKYINDNINKYFSRPGECPREENMVARAELALRHRHVMETDTIMLRMFGMSSFAYFSLLFAVCFKRTNGAQPVFHAVLLLIPYTGM